LGKIIVGKSIAQFSSKLKIEERLWHVKSGRATGKSHVAVELNRELNKINLLIHSRYSELLKRNGTVTAQEVKNAFQGIASEQVTLLSLYDEMMQDFHARIDIDRAKVTYIEYGCAQKHLRRFIKEKYKVRDIPLSQLDLTFIEKYDFYLRVERKYKPSFIITVLVPLKKVVRMALNRGLIDLLPFAGFEPERPEQQLRSLNADEFQRIVSTPLSSQVQSLVRDLFVFSSFTGVSYADLKSLTWKEIVADESGSLWISKSRQKTGIPFNVKLLDIPVRIMEKYRGLADKNLVFPAPKLLQTNIALKRIARHCGIDRTLTFHMSRHTFATQICLSQGVPIESVSKMLGHRHLVTTQRYASVSNEKLIGDMKQLSMRLEDKFAFSETSYKSIK
jgi:integrase